MAINPWFSNPPAIWSFFGIIGCLGALIVGFLYLWFCYYPGGYKKSEVMDIGEYAMFVAQVKVEERRKQVDKTEEDDYHDQYDGLYHERGDQDYDEDGDEEAGSYMGGEEGGDYAEKEKGKHPDWQSVAGSEHQTDIEGDPVYDVTSSSSPSSRSFSRSQTLEARSNLQSPGSQAAAPYQGGGYPRDDSRSESTPGSGSRARF